MDFHQHSTQTRQRVPFRGPLLLVIGPVHLNFPVSLTRSAICATVAGRLLRSDLVLFVEGLVESDLAKTSSLYAPTCLGSVSGMARGLRGVTDQLWRLYGDR